MEPNAEPVLFFVFFSAVVIFGRCRCIPAKNWPIRKSPSSIGVGVFPVRAATSQGPQASGQVLSASRSHHKPHDQTGRTE
ncbi:hypothetical protein B0J18DRAFT_182249 [Chaetomium sp. MPI-SDFR-AT-0129]|nr:hypothetical protein B0J18DRAFT_182249 [Chaetomium sp. MPI-SDFR-AT-0129]